MTREELIELRHRLKFATIEMVNADQEYALAAKRRGEARRNLEDLHARLLDALDKAVDR